MKETCSEVLLHFNAPGVQACKVRVRHRHDVSKDPLAFSCVEPRHLITSSNWN